MRGRTNAGGGGNDIFVDGNVIEGVVADADGIVAGDFVQKVVVAKELVYDSNYYTDKSDVMCLSDGTFAITAKSSSVWYVCRFSGGKNGLSMIATYQIPETFVFVQTYDEDTFIGFKTWTNEAKVSAYKIFFDVGANKVVVSDFNSIVIDTSDNTGSFWVTSNNNLKLFKITKDVYLTSWITQSKSGTNTFYYHYYCVVDFLSGEIGNQYKHAVPVSLTYARTPLIYDDGEHFVVYHSTANAGELRFVLMKLDGVNISEINTYDVDHFMGVGNSGYQVQYVNDNMIWIKYGYYYDSYVIYRITLDETGVQILQQTAGTKVWKFFKSTNYFIFCVEDSHSSGSGTEVVLSICSVLKENLKGIVDFGALPKYELYVKGYLSSSDLIPNNFDSGVDSNEMLVMSCSKRGSSSSRLFLFQIGFSNGEFRDFDNNVQFKKLSGHINGVAKQSGAQGEVIEVYVPKAY